MEIGLLLLLIVIVLYQHASVKKRLDSLDSRLWDQNQLIGNLNRVQPPPVETKADEAPEPEFMPLPVLDVVREIVPPPVMVTNIDTVDPLVEPLTATATE